jgi:nucleoside-diphosphate-sugar epimerase
MHAILGGSGNIGMLLTQYLISKGEKVVSIGRTRPEETFEGVEYRCTDYYTADSIHRAIKDCKYVYLLVGLPYKTPIWKKEWPELMNNVIEACHYERSKIIFFDNVYMYGQVDGPMTESLPFKPNSKKGEVRAKIANTLLDNINKRYVHGVIARSGDFYGANLDNSVVGTRFIQQLSKGTLELMGNKDMIHTYTYLNDCPEALYTLATDDTNNGETFHLPTTSEQLTQLQFGQLYAETMDVTIKKTTEIQGLTLTLFSLFAPILGEFKEMVYQFQNSYILDSTKILTRYPQLKVTPYKEAIKKILEK